MLTSSSQVPSHFPGSRHHLSLWYRQEGAWSLCLVSGITNMGEVSPYCSSRLLQVVLGLEPGHRVQGGLWHLPLPVLAHKEAGLQERGVEESWQKC